MRRFLPLSLLGLLILTLNSPLAWAEQAAAQVYFINLQDGAVLTSPIKIQFGLRGMGIAPAGIDHPNTGHHHLLINLDKLPPIGESMPANEQLRHFGGGQTETSLELKPGVYTLQLALGDYLHRLHNPPIVSERIKITVK